MNEFQRTDSWYQDRLGKATASRMGDLMAQTKTGYGASRGNYMAELLIERLTGAPTEGYQSPAMLRGIELEPAALAHYCFDTDLSVDMVGFINHPRIQMAGCSPDGLVGSEGLVEIKCPTSKTHLGTLLTGKVDVAYIDQMQFQMACTGRSYCDFVSYDPHQHETMQLRIIRVMRDDKAIDKIELEVTQFLIDVDATVDLLRKRYMQEAA